MTSDAEFRFEGDFKVTDEMKKCYEENGYFIVKGFLDEEERKQIWNVLDEKKGILKHSYTTTEPDGKKIRRVMYQHPGNDVTGIIARSEKVAGACEEILGGEVYHYHSKFILKDPREGGSHVWHQDYGYWYEFGNIFPEMTTVWMALDKTTRQNSCLQVLKGSHKCGRIQHNATGALQAGADLSRVEALKERCPLVYCEMEPGDVLFLHCNTLHTSMPNDSDMRRWAFICCYNKASNNPYVKHHHPQYTPLHKVPNSAIKECRNYTDFSGKDFTDPTRKEEDRKTFPPMLVAK